MHNNDPNWTTAEMVQYPSGQAALVLELMLMIMMFGNVLDEVRQMRTYKRWAAGAVELYLPELLPCWLHQLRSTCCTGRTRS